MNRLILAVALQFCAVALAAAQTPTVIAFQAPPGPDGYGYNSMTYTTSGCGTAAVTQFACFTQSVMPKVSGVGFVIPWGIIDNCAVLGTTADQPCMPDSACTTNCYNWKWIDEAIGDYVLGISTSSSFSSGCAASKPCKIVLIVWLTQDSGNTNTYAGTPNTPAYVFSTTYANSLNGNAGCGSNCAQDVMVCKDWQGGPGGTGWSGNPQIIDPAWAAGGGAGDFGLWNAYGYDILANQSGYMRFNSLPNGNFSGYPVMYEQPIMTAAESFLSALALHYSSACTFASCTSSWTNTWGSYSISSAAIAPYIAYMRIGPSSGGENYPYCACTGSAGASQCGTGTSHAFWPGPTGYNNGESQEYSDQGYLTAWPSGVTPWPASDTTGYVAKLYKFIHSQNWAFPIDTPTHNGPASNMNVSYSDTEAQLASEYGLGMGMQAASIGDLVTYATQYYPSTGSNWAGQFREFPYVPDHHLQTMNPGNPVQAAQFTVTSVSTSGLSTSSAVVTCGSGCNNYCTSPPWVFITGTNVPAFNGIQEVDMTKTCTSTTLYITSAAASYPPSTTSSGGLMYSGAHLPVLLPFESQQCQASFQTICSAELWDQLATPGTAPSRADTSAAASIVVRVKAQIRNGSTSSGTQLTLQTVAGGTSVQVLANSVCVLDQAN